MIHADLNISTILPHVKTNVSKTSLFFLAHKKIVIQRLRYLLIKLAVPFVQEIVHLTKQNASQAFTFIDAVKQQWIHCGHNTY